MKGKVDSSRAHDMTFMARHSDGRLLEVSFWMDDGFQPIIDEACDRYAPGQEVWKKLVPMAAALQDRQPLEGVKTAVGKALKDDAEIPLGRLLMVLAARNDWSDTFDWLVEQGVDPLVDGSLEKRNSKGQRLRLYPWKAALAMGSVGVMERMVAHHGDRIWEKPVPGAFGCTPLMVLSSAGSRGLELAMGLLERHPHLFHQRVPFADGMELDVLEFLGMPMQDTRMQPHRASAASALRSWAAGHEARRSLAELQVHGAVHP